MIKAILFLLLINVLVSVSLSAQDVGEINTDTNAISPKEVVGYLKEVTISATRKSTELNSIPYSVSIVSKKQITAYQYRTTPEALAGTTGVFVQKTNHGGGSPFVRGLTGNQTLYLVDGIRLNNSTCRYGPNQYFNTIDAGMVSSIEVARGTGSVQYGSDALGGVVQVFTGEPSFNKDKSLHATIRGKATTQDMEYSGRATVEYSSEKLAMSAGYSNKKFGDLVGGDTTGKQSPSGYSERSYDVKLKYKPTHNSVLTLAHQWLQQKDVPLYHKVKLENYLYYYFDPQQRQMSYAKLEVSAKNKWLEKTTFITSLQKSLERREYQKNGNANKFSEEDKVKTWGAVVDVFSAISKKWTANSGVEYYHDLVNSYKQQITLANNHVLNQRGLYPNNATSGNFSLYSLHHITAGKFGIESGLRYNNVAIRIPDTVTTALKMGDITVNTASFVGNLALLYHLGKNQQLYSSFSTGYRTPNIDDLGSLGLVDFRYEIPAYDLKPEKTYNTEVGYRIRTKRLQSSIALFYMKLTDLITRVQVPGQQVGGYNVYTKENSQQSYIKGTEITFNFRITKAFTVKSNATYLYGQNITANEPMRRIPPFNGRILLDYSQHNWSISGEYLFAGMQSRLAMGDKDDNRIPVGGTPGWNVLNFYGWYSLNRLLFNLAVQNIFNAGYRVHGSGINGVGRSASLAVQISI